MADSLNDITRASFTLGTNHGCPFADAAQCLAEVTRSTHERDGEEVFIDMEMFVGRCQYLRLVDAIHAYRLEDFSFDKMSDAALGHDRNGDRLFDLDNKLGVAHTSNATMSANIGRHALESHNCTCPGLFRDARLFRVHNIANYSAFEHFRKCSFNLYGSCLLLHDCISPDMIG